MSKLTLENITIKDHKIYDESGQYRGEILYEYIRGSQLYHTNLEGIDEDGNPLSDEDHGGIYIMPDSTLLGLGLDYQNEIKDKVGDTCIWEINRFMQLALSSNPTVLEALFVPDDKVIYEHPVIKEFRQHRDLFVTKKCFAPFGGYSVSQIKKAQGQNKKIHWDIEKMIRKTPLDFCFTFNGQGSQNIQDWLKERGLDQRNCGLVNIPNMPDVYGVYYDFGQHIIMSGINEDDFCDEKSIHSDFVKFCCDTVKASWGGYLNIREIYDAVKTPKGGYCGIVSPDLDSNEIRFSSVKKGQSPICFMTYNANAYATHCRKYKEYEEWKTHRNKARYESNMEGERSGNPDLMFDSKNMMHCFRLMAMAKEVAEGKGILLDRTDIDREFLLDVRNRKYGYSELMTKMLDLKEEMDKAIQTSTIREEIDEDIVNSLLLNIRKQIVI